MRRGAWLLTVLALAGAACSTTAGTTTITSATPASTAPSTMAPPTTLPPTTTTALPPRLFDQVACFFTGDPPRLVPYLVRVPGTARSHRCRRGDGGWVPQRLTLTKDGLLETERL